MPEDSPYAVAEQLQRRKAKMTKDEEQPLVSVIIPAYNRAKTVREAVQSVLSQSYETLEVILVDDGSTDDTKAVIESMKDPRLQYVYQTNAGACAARNRGAALAKGEYIAFHDSDDHWHPDKLEKQMRILREKQADVVVCKMNRFGMGEGVIRCPRRVGEGFLSEKDDLFGIGTQTIVARRAVPEEIRFRPQMPRYQDLEWFIHALQKYRIYCMDEALVDYYIGSDSISRGTERMYGAFALLREHYPALPAKSPALSLHIVKDLLGGYRQMKKTDPGQSRKYLVLAKWYFPGIGLTLSNIGKLRKQNG